MTILYYENNELYIENISLKNIAQQYDTPTYVYSRAMIESNWQTFESAFKAIPHHICYAVKANANLTILKLLAKYNAGFDIVSGGELQRVLSATGQNTHIIFSGVGKTQKEIEFAIEKNIFCFDVESTSELLRLNSTAAKKNKMISIALRINPDIEAFTHSHISTGRKENKFGISVEECLEICENKTMYPHLKFIGLACHIGSQLTKLAPFLQALDKVLNLYQRIQAKGHNIQFLNLGGGLGIPYHLEQPPSINEYAQAIYDKLSSLPITLILEPGRVIIANAGILLTRVEYLKNNHYKNFAVVDAGMNDFIRPALYEAWQPILAVFNRNGPKQCYDVVGPVCESADVLGKNRKLCLQEGDLLAIDLAGAYGFSMSSNYNSRCRAAEVLIDGDTAKLIRKRETIEDLLALELSI